MNNLSCPAARRRTPLPRADLHRTPSSPHGRSLIAARVVHAQHALVMPQTKPRAPGSPRRRQKPSPSTKKIRTSVFCLQLSAKSLD
ncbi:hypothetical protein HMPREF3036_02525 [Sutterella sp. KLE1602]|nr:hypothetical protein HMPREF3036_02525 [Sutterella sp. KLE1602]